MDNGNDISKNIQVKSITVRTCVGTYDRLRNVRPNLYGNAPSEGIDLTINYYDTLDTSENPLDLDQKLPIKTIVAVHGLPGNHTHFDPIPQYFATNNNNIRMIVPNLPDFSHTRKTGSFWHSTEEKCQFLKDFLKKLNVKRIDCLIGHSFGMQTISQFWDQPDDIEIESFLWLSPQPRVEVGCFITKLLGLLFMSKSDWWYDLLGFLQIHRNCMIPMRLERVDQFLQICTAGYETESPAKIPERIDRLVNSGRPIIMLFGSRERLISQSSIAALQKYLQIDQSEIVHIDPEYDSPEERVRMERPIMYYYMKNGGHFAHANYHQFTVKMIENLLGFNRNNNNNNDNDDKEQQNN